MAFRAAIIGCGAVGSMYDNGAPRPGDPLSHAGAYVLCSETELIAGADIDPGRRRGFEKAWHTRAYEDARAMLAQERPDIVSVCTDPSAHADAVEAAVEAGVGAVFCEKPLADSLEAGSRILEVCELTRVPLVVNFLRRWDPAHQAARDLIAARGIGDIERVDIRYSKGTFNTGSHAIDLMRFFLGEIASVRARDRLQQRGADPTLDILLRMRSGVDVELIGRPGREEATLDVEVNGAAGRLLIAECGFRFELYRPGLSRDRSAAPPEFDTPMSGPLLAAVEDVVDAAAGRAEPRVSGTDGLAVLQVLVAARESAADGGVDVGVPAVTGAS